MGSRYGGQLVVEALRREGVSRIFSLSGGVINPIYDACLAAGIAVVHTRHEGGAGFMADGWARATGQPGVCVVTLGPGVTTANRHVVRVEQVGEERVERPVVGGVRAEQERLEEPTGVREVPLGRAGLGGGLELVVLGLQRLAKPLGGSADGSVAVQEGAGRYRTFAAGDRRHGAPGLGSPASDRGRLHP